MSRGQKLIIIHDVLYMKYVIEHKSCRQIAKELNTTHSAIIRHMKKHNILRRESPAHISKRYGSISYEDIKAFYMTRIRRHALELKLEYKITAEEIYKLFVKQEKRCALTGLPITLNKDASLDRIDSSCGYIINNVQWIHKKLQKMKQSLSNEDFIHWCSLVGKYYDTTTNPECNQQVQSEAAKS
jgi:hypothetical protein